VAGVAFLSLEPLSLEPLSLEPLVVELSFEPLELDGVSFAEEPPVPESDDVVIFSGLFSDFCSDFLPAALEPWSFL